MATSRICIIGNEISSLSTAFFLRRRFPTAQITLIASPERCQTKTTRGQFHFEEGLRSNVLNSRNGREVLGLCRLLQLDDQVISGNLVNTARRHIYLNDKVQYFPRVIHLLKYGLFFVTESLIPRQKKDIASTEDVASFFRRRFSASVEKDLVEPLTWGISGLRSKDASAKWIYPRIWHNEQTHGSIFIGAFMELFHMNKYKSWLSLSAMDFLNQKISNGGRVFSFRDGMDVLPEALLKKIQSPKVERSRIPVNIITDATVKSIAPFEGNEIEKAAGIVTLSNGEKIHADYVFSGLSSIELAEKVSLSHPKLAQSLENIPHQRMAVVNIGFSNLKLKLRAAGYVCPPEENVYLVSIPSKTFLEHNNSEDETRITVYMPILDERNTEEFALKILKKHLDITDTPDAVAVQEWNLPLYTAEHDNTLLDVEKKLWPWLKVLGPSYHGSSVADEVVNARIITDALPGNVTPEMASGKRVILQTH